MRTSPSCFSGLKTVLFYLSLGALVSVLVLPIVAFALLRRVLGAVVGGLAAGIGTWLVLCCWVFALGACLVWLALTGEWCQLLRLLPRFIELLRSVGLL
jgi:hypothetical protein